MILVALLAVVRFGRSTGLSLMAYCLYGGIVPGKIFLTHVLLWQEVPGDSIFANARHRKVSAGALCESLLSPAGLISPDFVPQSVICAMAVWAR